MQRSIARLQRLILETQIGSVVLPFVEQLLLYSLQFRSLTYPRDVRHSDHTVVTVVCHKDRVAYLCMVLSLRSTTRKQVKFVALNDGSLSHSEVDLFRRFNINVIDKTYETWQEQKYLSLPSIFANQNLLLIDSDVLFFQEPKELFFKSDHVHYMNDLQSRYSLSHEEILHFFGFSPRQKVNTGIVKIHSSLIKKSIFLRAKKYLDKVEQSRLVANFFLEQSVFAILFGELSQVKRVAEKITPLPQGYHLLIRSVFGNQRLPEKIVCIHYTGLLERQRILDSVLLFWRTGCFTS